MSVAWPCNFGRNAILKHRESFARGSSIGMISDMNVQGTENAAGLRNPFRRKGPTKRSLFRRKRRTVNTYFSFFGESGLSWGSWISMSA